MLNRDGELVLGCRAGPEVSYVNLTHEMAHFIEIDDARMMLPRWGLRLPRVYVAGRECVEPVTTQITEREIRVIAYQANLLEYLGSPQTVESTIESLQWLPDFFLLPIENGTYPYSEEGKVVDMSSKEVDASRTRWTANRVAKERETYTMERFLAEWTRKTTLLRENPSMVRV